MRPEEVVIGERYWMFSDPRTLYPEDRKFSNSIAIPIEFQGPYNLVADMLGVQTKCRACREPRSIFIVQIEDSDIYLRCCSCALHKIDPDAQNTDEEHEDERQAPRVQQTANEPVT